MKEPCHVFGGVYMVGSGDISHPYDCCVYLVDFGELMMIDCGAGRSFDRLVSNVRKLGFDTERLKSVLATHCHIDHIGSLHEFRREFGARVIAHELDAGAIEEGGDVAAEAYGIDYTPCKVDLKLRGAESSIELGDGEVRVVHIPGHTPGSVAAYVDVDGKRVLFGQDIHGPYYPHWGADPEKARRSLGKLLGLRADILCEGHFGVYEPAGAVREYIEAYERSL